MAVTNVVVCPFCVEGHDYNTNSGSFIDCWICQGTGFLTPDDICACGGSCTTATPDGFNSCGNPKCLTELRQAARIDNLVGITSRLTPNRGTNFNTDRESSLWRGPLDDPRFMH